MAATSRAIMLVEDDEDLAKIVQTTLLAAGHRVHWAANGKEALMTINDHRFDLALVDLQMPELDGLSFLKAIKSHPQTHCTRVIVMTGTSRPWTASDCLSAGAFDFMQKPITLPDLVSRVRRALEA